MRVRYVVVSKDGGRKVNEDAVLGRAEGDRFLFALADGLGGHGMGELASALAVRTMAEAFDADDAAPEETLSRGVGAAQGALRKLQLENRRPNDYKTTIVALIIQDGSAFWVHSGDSRLYRFEGSELAERTLDHSVPQMLVVQGEIRERDIRFHEDRNRLTRVLGMDADTPRVTPGGPAPLFVPSAFLLCSDGFWELIDERDMGRSLKRSTGPDEWLDDMTKTVERAGRGKSMDNYSAIAVMLD